MRHLEIPWSEIHQIIRTKLLVAGFDLNKEVVNWAKFEEDNVTMVFEQADDAELTKESRMQQAISNRPSYLERLGR